MFQNIVISIIGVRLLVTFHSCNVSAAREWRENQCRRYNGSFADAKGAAEQCSKNQCHGPCCMTHGYSSQKPEQLSLSLGGWQLRFLPSTHKRKHAKHIRTHERTNDRMHAHMQCREIHCFREDPSSLESPVYWAQYNHSS